MRRINYFQDCETEYLQTLGLLNEERKETPDFDELKKSWGQFIKDNSLTSIFTEADFKKILTGSFNTLVDFFISYEKASKSIIKKSSLFNYSTYSKKIANFFKKNADKLGIYTCFYCEAAFSGIYKLNTVNKRTFDVEHFFPNEQYPFFSLSLYNFVPSCQVCNSRIKASSKFKDFYKLSPKIDTTNEEAIKLTLLAISPTSPGHDFSNNVTIRIIPSVQLQKVGKGYRYSNWSASLKFSDKMDLYKVLFDTEIESPYEKEIQAMRLEERYNSTAIKLHALYLKDLMRNYPDSKIQRLKELLKIEDIKNDIFKIKNMSSGKMILEKMTNDILDENL